MRESADDPPIDPSVLIGTCIANRWELEELIGRGPASFVYRAVDGESSSPVAVKLLLDGRGFREVSGIDHPAIVRPIATGTTEYDATYLVTPLFSGRSLASAVADDPPAADEAIRIVVDTAEVLGAAHAVGFVHGNLKPSDVLLVDGSVKILDFSLEPRPNARPSRTVSAQIRAMASVVGDASSNDAASLSGAAAEPETKTAALDPRDDVHALGMMLHGLLAASRRSTPSSEPATIGLEPRFQAVLAVMLRAMASDPERRPVNGTELAHELFRATTATPAKAKRRPGSLPVDSSELLGRTIGQRYRIERVIGRGASAIVFEALHLELSSRVALKVLAPIAIDDDPDDSRDRFRFEAQVLADLRHPNVVRVFDLGTTGDGLRYMAMELLEGETLAAMLKLEPRLEPELAVHIASELAEALDALHARGLVHRDVKPANIFVSGSGKRPYVKLMDFGLARAVDSLALRNAEQSRPPEGGASGPRRRQRTLEGMILGTGAYMSPELIQSKKLDGRSDVYALAVVTYRMLTGAMPFEADDLAHLLACHICQEPTPPRERAPAAKIPTALDRAVLAGLAKNRDERPASAGAFAALLRDALEAAPAESPPKPTPSPLPPPPVARGRSPWRRRIAAATGAIAALSILLVLFARRAPPEPSPVATHAPASPPAPAPRATSEAPKAMVPPTMPVIDPPPPSTTTQTPPPKRPRPSAAPSPPRPRRAPEKVDDLKSPNWRR
jgi:serine/threonine protein kinase